MAPAGEGEVREALSSTDKVMARFGEQPVTTVSFFREPGKQAPSKELALDLKQRVTEVLASNPWLAGRVERQELVFTPGPPDSVDRFFVVEERASFGRQTPYRELCELTKPHIASSLGGDKPMFLVTLMPTKPPEGEQKSDGFALVVSVSHVLGDGHTYYSLLNMLTGAAPVTALNPKRKEDVTRKIAEEAIEYEVLTDWGYAADLLWGAVTGTFMSTAAYLASWLPFSIPYRKSDHQIRFSYLDTTYLTKQKQEAVRSGEVPFVSTNDVITSCFIKAFDVGCMAINFRGRLEGCLASDAGNYESLIPYVGVGDAGRPALIRRSLLNNRFRRACDPADPLEGCEPSELPKGRKVINKTVALISSWASFKLEPKLKGSTEQMHLPVWNLSPGSSKNYILNSRMLAAAVVFRSAGRACVMVIGNSCLLAKLEWEDSLLGESLDLAVYRGAGREEGNARDD